MLEMATAFANAAALRALGLHLKATKPDLVSDLRLSDNYQSPPMNASKSNASAPVATNAKVTHAK